MQNNGACRATDALEQERKAAEGRRPSIRRGAEFQPPCENTQRSRPPSAYTPRATLKFNNGTRLKSVFNWPATGAVYAAIRRKVKNKSPLKTQLSRSPIDPRRDIRHRFRARGSQGQARAARDGFCPSLPARSRRPAGLRLVWMPLCSAAGADRLFAVSSLFSHHTMIGLPMAMEE